MNTNRIAVIGVVALSLTAATAARAQYTADYQTNTISGVTSNWTGDYLVGSNTFADVLLIQSSGVLSNGFGYLGYEASSSNNTVLVTGSGSAWSNLDALVVGSLGAGNSLVISNGGQVVDGRGYIGSAESSSSNTVLVAGNGSVWSTLDALVVGSRGVGNSLVISNGGQVVDGRGYVGSAESSSNNTALVTGSGSVWSNPVFFCVGGYGSGNQLTIAAGGAVYGDTLTGWSAHNNTVLVTGTGSVLNGDVTIGYDGGQGNRLIVTNGGAVYGGGAIGTYGSGSSSNMVLVTGSGSVWTNTNDLTIGDDGAGNQLTIADGGAVYGCSSHSGGNLVGHYGDNNTVLVTGSGSVWSNCVAGGYLYVGVNGGGNQLIVSNGGAVYNGGMVGVYSDDNTILVTGSGSILNGDFGVGSLGASNRLIVSNGGAFYGGGTIGGYASSSNNNVLVCGPGSVWSNRNELYIGNFGTGNSLVISNGGLVVGDYAEIGYSSSASNNSLRVIDNGTLKSSTLDVGYGGSSNLLAIVGGLVIANNLLISHSDDVWGIASNNVVRMDSGSLIVTNATGNGSLVVGLVGGKAELILNSGTVTADLLVATNGANSVLAFNGGTLTAKAVTVANGAVLQYALGTNGNPAVVSSNLTLDGTLNITDAGGFSTGSYTLFRYTGTLITNGSASILTIGTTPNTNLSYTVDITSNGYVKLRVVIPPPVAAFTGSPTNGVTSLVVTFSDVSTRAITNRFWSFGDGITTNTTVTTLSHTYNAGTYSVSLTVFGPGGSNTLTRPNYIVVVHPPPSITQQPQAQTVCPGSTAAFAVAATGGGTLAYQWQKNGTNLTNSGHYSGVTTSNLTVSSAGAGDAANYRCVVSNDGGGTPSDPAALALRAATAITGQPAPQSVCPGTSGTFTVSAMGDGTLGYQWQKNGGSLTNGGHYAGVTTATLTVSSADVSDAANYSCVVTAGCGAVTSSPAALTLQVGRLAVSPASLGFGSVATGTSAQVSFVVTNSGCGMLNGTATVGSGPFAIVGGSSYSVSGYGSTNVAVSFLPTAVGQFTNRVIFSSNGGSSTNTVTGAGVMSGHLVVAPGSRSFGTIVTGTTAQASFTVSNTGGVALSGSASVPAPFAIASGSPFNLAGGASTNVVVSFTPASAGSFSTNVVFTSNGGNSTNAVSGSGAIVPVALFSGTPTNGPVPLTVTFTNASTGTITNSLWSFGDGATSNTPAPSVVHTYNAAGLDTVRLIVTGPVGVSTNTRVDYISVALPCSYTLSATNASFGAAGGASNVVVTTTNYCAWTATSAAPWIVIAGGSDSVTGSAMVAYSVLSNATNTNSRTGTMTIAGQTFTVTQASNAPPQVLSVAAVPPVITLPVTTVNLSASVTDDGAPYGTLSTTWSKASGVGSVTFGSLSAVNTTATFSTNGTYVLRLTANDGALSASNDVTVIVNAPPRITMPPTVASNALLQVGNLVIVPSLEPIPFTVGAFDPDGDSWNCQWVSCENITNTDCDPVYVFSNCGPCVVSVTITDNVAAAVSSNFTVTVPCLLNITKLQGTLNFAKTNADSCTVKGTFSLPASYSFSNKLVTLDIGEVEVPFGLGSKGSGRNGLSTFSKPTYSKKTGLWTFNATLKNGSWQTAWAEYSMINSNIPKPGVLVTNFPVILILDTDAFMGTTNLHYTAKQGKSGTAK